MKIKMKNIHKDGMKEKQRGKREVERKISMMESEYVWSCEPPRRMKYIWIVCCCGYVEIEILKSKRLFLKRKKNSAEKLIN